jgi:choline dehydrogenase-like flavoprotein
MTTHIEQEFDFIVVGAGISGTVVASRLHEQDPVLTILLIEAGPDPSGIEAAKLAAIPLNAPLLKHSELDWDYTTLPQKNLDDKERDAASGKGVGGGSLINYGTGPLSSTL